ACGLRHQHVLGVARLALNNLARGRAPDFLIGNEQLSDRQATAAAEPRHLAKGMESKEGASLHVVGSGTVGTAALALAGQAFDEAKRMHGVEVGEHENATVGATPARACDQMVCETVAAGNAFELGASACVGALNVVDHTVDGIGNRGWAFDLHPAANLGEHSHGIELRFVHSAPLSWPLVPLR